MNETLENLMLKVAADINSAAVGFAVLCGYLCGSSMSTAEWMGESKAEKIKLISDLKTRAKTPFFTEEELKKVPKLKDGRPESLRTVIIKSDTERTGTICNLLQKVCR